MPFGLSHGTLWRPRRSRTRWRFLPVLQLCRPTRVLDYLNQEKLNFLFFFPGSCNLPPRYQWHRFDMISIPHHFFSKITTKTLETGLFPIRLNLKTPLYEKRGGDELRGVVGEMNCWRKELWSFCGGWALDCRQRCYNSGVSHVERYLSHRFIGNYTIFVSSFHRKLYKRAKEF